ncbi:MAG: hypothetical protein IJA55_01360 [Clostridia bacterium]|nr:hypothetical protein [Clostridia bacterium]
MELERALRVTKANLDRLEKAKYSINTRRYAHIRELGIILAELLPEKGEDFEDFRHRYSEIITNLSPTEEENVLLCRAIAEKAGDMRDNIPLVLAKRRCRLSYVKNPLSDLAYDSFSVFFDKAAVSYADDFISAVEDVYHGQSDYAILPVYSEKGGRLKSFCDLADKYELKKVLTCRVYSNTEDTETEFALFSKSCERFSGNRRKEVFFELSLPLADILGILEYVRVTECDVIFISTTEDRADICLEIPENGVSSLYVYLMLCLPDHEIKGIY